MATWSRFVGLSLDVEAVDEFRPVYLDSLIHCVGVERSAGLSVGVQGESQVRSGLNLTLQGMVPVYAGLDVHIFTPPPYRYMRLRGDTSTRYFGGFESDPAFAPVHGFDPPGVAHSHTAMVGAFEHVFRGVLYKTSDAPQSSVTYDKYVLPLSNPLVMNTVGARCVVAFDIKALGPNASLVFGLSGSNDATSLVDDISNGAAAVFVLSTENGHVGMRGWFGSGDTGANILTGVHLSRFVDNPLVVEMEIVSAGVTTTLDFRLFERSVSLDTPFASFQVAASIVPTVTHFVIASLGRLSGEHAVDPDALKVELEYVDVERGTGLLYDPANTWDAIQVAEAKLRPYQDRPPFMLAQEGSNTVVVELSKDGTDLTIPTQATVVVDTTDPIITVTVFEPNSRAVMPDRTNPTVMKGSLNPGFSQVHLVWHATHSGYWTLRANSSGAVDGVEMASGNYLSPEQPEDLVWDYAMLPPVDGVYDVTLYLIADNGKPTAKKLGEYIVP
jgi:hypothetical protein